MSLPVADPFMEHLARTAGALGLSLAMMGCSPSLERPAQEYLARGDRERACLRAEKVGDAWPAPRGPAEDARRAGYQPEIDAVVRAQQHEADPSVSVHIFDEEEIRTLFGLTGPFNKRLLLMRTRYKVSRGSSTRLRVVIHEPGTSWSANSGVRKDREALAQLLSNDDFEVKTSSKVDLQHHLGVLLVLFLDIPTLGMVPLGRRMVEGSHVGAAVDTVKRTVKSKPKLDPSKPMTDLVFRLIWAGELSGEDTCDSAGVCERYEIFERSPTTGISTATHVAAPVAKPTLQVSLDIRAAIGERHCKVWNSIAVPLPAGESLAQRVNLLFQDERRPVRELPADPALSHAHVSVGR